MPAQPLAGIRVVDFSTRLPGPLATLILAEAGAEVIKIEAPGGDPLRFGRQPWLDGEAAFALLNRGKRSLTADLKAPADRERVWALVDGADVVLEQFRPGVMQRLGFGYEAVSARNPRAIYCSITGYGQDGPWADRPGHDLTYLAETGILSLLTDAQGTPIVSGALIADIAGGAYPAALNVLLALIGRQRSGAGAYLDIAMEEHVLPFAVWALANGFGSANWPQPARELYTGGNARYNVYRTSDDRFVAVAALEDKFWRAFCAAIGFDPAALEERSPQARRAIAAAIAARDAAFWRGALAAGDTCAAVVESVQEALAGEHLIARGVFERTVDVNGRAIPALPVPVVPAFRARQQAAAASPGHARSGE